MTFWIVVGALTVFALGLVVFPLWRKTANSAENEVERSELNIVIYRERLAELEQVELSPEQRALAEAELEKTLLQDLEATPPSVARQGARWVALPVILLLPALALGMYWHFGSPSLLQAPAAPDQQAQPAMPPIDELVARLEAKMQAQPDDPKGWEMLGRSYVVMERYQEAAAAYAKAVGLVGEQRADLLADYAEVLALQKEGQLTGQPATLVAKALTLEPEQPKILWLAGLVAVQQHEYPLAIQHWEKLLTKLTPDSESWQSVSMHLKELKLESEMPVAAATKPAEAPAETAATAVNSNKRLSIQVEIDPALHDKLKPDDTLFIYARAATGPRMPLAIVRKQAKDLPVTATLDDTMAMTPAMRLSQFPQVIAMARISSSGSAMPQAGDLLGESAPLSLNEAQTAVQVQINQVVP